MVNKRAPSPNFQGVGPGERWRIVPPPTLGEKSPKARQADPVAVSWQAGRLHPAAIKAPGRLCWLCSLI